MRVPRAPSSQRDAPLAVGADFCNGGAPAFARVFDRRGREISTLDRLDDESLSDFRQRARVEAQNLAGAVRVVVRVFGAEL